MNAQSALRRAQARDPEATSFVVRHWDGFDGDWWDVTPAVSAEVAMDVWNQRTNHGSRMTSYNDIDYYAILPSTVKMVFSDEGIGSQFKEVR